MRVIIHWQFSGSGGSRSRTLRLKRLDDVLERAAQTARYKREGVALPECAPRDEAFLPQCLESIPTLDMDDFLRQPADLYNWQNPQVTPAPLEFAVPHLGRTAVLGQGFASDPQVAQFPYHTLEDLDEYEPESLAGPASKLLRLAEQVLAGRFLLPSLRTAVIPFTGLRHGCLKPEQRDLLWRAFRVPAFEQFRGFAQELLAWECEAHDGLHIREQNAIFEKTGRNKELLLTCLACEEYALLRLGTHMTARLVTAPCGCGETSPRLLGLREMAAAPVAMAAYA